MESETLKPLSTAGEIDQRWIANVLSQKFKTPITVQSLKSRLPSGRGGYLSEIAFLEVSYSVSDGDGIQKDICLVLKVLPQDPKLRQILMKDGIAKREVEFYKLIDSGEFQEIRSSFDVDIPVPEAYFADCSEEAFTLVLHDLTVDGYENIIIKEGLDYNRVKVALEAVAQIHAAGLMYLRKYGTGKENMAAICSALKLEITYNFLLPNMKKLVEMTENTPFSSVISSLEPVCKLIMKLSQKNTLITTIIHGDYWAGQLLYSESGNKAKAIDWQFCQIGNPVIDLVSMFFMSCDPVVLDCHLEDLVRSYWQAFRNPLQTAGIPLNVTYEEFKTNVDDLLIFGFAFLVISLEDFLESDHITLERILGAIKFLEARNAFAKFFQLVEQGELSCL